MAFNLRQLRAEDAASLVVLRREALESDPLAFGASTEDDRGLSRELVQSSLADDQEQRVFGYFEGDTLTGMIGLIRVPTVKQRHKGTIWGMYVAPRARHKGVGRALLEAAIQHGRRWGLEQVQLGVTEAALTAKRLYEAAGFRSWGREPRALAWEGRAVDEFHLVLDLHGPAGALPLKPEASCRRRDSLSTGDDIQRAAYDLFAWVYNRHWGGNAAWMLTAVRELVLRNLPPPGRVLDLCCGTGQLDGALQALGYEVTGVDESAEMIGFARENAPACEFIVCDVREFAAPGAFDLALCMYDSLNHVMTLEDLRRAFRAIHGGLRGGAPFLFDLNMEEGFRERWRGSFGIVEADHACVVRSRFLAQDGTGELRATIFRRDHGWTRSDVVLRQRCYSADDVAGALSAEGFSDIRVIDALTDLNLTGQVGRSFFLSTA